MVRQRTVNPWGRRGLYGFESRPLHHCKAPVEALTSARALLRAAEATTVSQPDYTLLCADFNGDSHNGTSQLQGERAKARQG